MTEVHEKGNFSSCRQHEVKSLPCHVIPCTFTDIVHGNGRLRL